MSVLIVATLYPAEGKLSELLELFAAWSGGIRAHELCELFAVHQDGNNVFIIEKWATETATQQPDLRAAIDQIGSRVGTLLGAPADVRRLTVIDGGPKSTV